MNSLALFLALAPIHADRPDNPGVLLIISDDQSVDDLGCYGHPVLRTPNLDRLASQGVRFTHAFATTASCSASRSVLYTGLHNHFNGQYGHAHAEHHFSQRPHVRTVFESLGNAGFRLGLIGKKHVLPEEKYVVDFEPRVDARDVSKMASLARRFLHEVGDRPFLLVMGYTDPHRSRRRFANERDYPGVVAQAYDPEDVVVPHFLPDEPEVRSEIADYYQAIDRLDQGIGKLMAAVDEAGVADRTLVLYLSDNGMPFPGAKTNIYDPGIHMPLLVRRPGGASAAVCEAMTSFVDVTPTILDWTGAEGPKTYALHGRSILPWTTQPNAPDDRGEVYASHTFHEVTMYYPMRAIRTQRFKFIWNIAAPLEFPHASDLYASTTWQGVLRRNADMLGSRPVEKYLQRDEYELYDLKADPEEIRNLADDPEFADVRTELAKKLRKFQETTRDPWAVRYRY